MVDPVPQLEDLRLHEGTRVLLRADLNVPLRDCDIEDDMRITASLPTIEWLLERGRRGSCVAPTSAGRRASPIRSTRWPPSPPASASCSAATCSSPPAWPSFDHARHGGCSLDKGQILMLENLRFDPGEESDDPAFATNLAELGDVYVDDAFGAAHRAHASIVGPPRVLPSAGGRLLAREVEVLSALLDAPKSPFVVVLGGVKVSDKLGVIDALLDRCDKLLIGGAMAFTFLVAQGAQVGDSLVEPDQIQHCVRLLATGKVVIPTDIVAAQDMTAESKTRHVGAMSHPRRLEGPRHRTRDRGHLCRTDRTSAHRAVERPDGRVRDGAVRGRNAHRCRGGCRLSRLHRRGWRRQRGSSA